jgi:DNA-3-methyladenine glycosylase
LPKKIELPRKFYDRPVVEVARELIGCVVEHAPGDGPPTSGVIVETEAYHESEPACHAFAGLTPRTQTLFGPPGRAYVYRSYGIHALLNAVCEEEGVGAAVLIRALEPLEGIESMRARRGVGRDQDLCSGPGKLTQALGIELTENGGDLYGGPVRIRPRPSTWRAGGHQIMAGTRIGITKAVELPWRFCAAHNRNVSRPWPVKVDRVGATGSVPVLGRKRKGVGMADRVLFISWHAPVRGREERGLEVFNEAMGLYGRMQQEGRIEKFDVVLLGATSDLAGYIELHGSAEQIAAIREDEEFQRTTIDASLIVDGLRQSEGVTDNEIARQMGLYQESIARVPQTA